jgi:Fic family protein
MPDPIQTRENPISNPIMKDDATLSNDLTWPPISDPKTLALYDEFQNEVRAQRVDVGRRIEAAIPQGETLAEQLGALDTLKTWLDSFRPLPATVVEELQKFYTVSLTYNSNAIEGNTLTQSETEIVLSQGVTVGGKTLVEHLEVIGHRDAMAYMEELAAFGSPLGEREVKDLHSLIMRPVDQATGHHEAGLYRSLDVRAAGTGTIYPAHYQLSELMNEFGTWLSSEAARKLHPVELASQAHFRFVSIHPFRDGNGRTARLLMNLCLLRAGYPITVITNARRAQYIEALVLGQSQSQLNNSSGEVTSWGNPSQLTILMVQACRESFVEYLRMLSTAGESRGRGGAFYQALLQRGEI